MRIWRRNQTVARLRHGLRFSRRWRAKTESGRYARDSIEVIEGTVDRKGKEVPILRIGPRVRLRSGSGYEEG